jgi:hypothetical protein
VRPVGGRLITSAWEVDGSDASDLAGRGLIYEDAFGDGLHLGVLTTNLAFRKIVRFDRLASLGAIPEGAEVLEVGFELQTDEATTFKASFGGEEARLWDKTETVLARGEPVEFAKADQRSFIRPAHAWDSAGDRIPIDLQFRSEGGRLFLTKLIPVAWLKRAVFPVFADVDVTFGFTGAYNAANTNRMSVTALDNTRVVIAYEDTANGGFGTAVVGTISGKTISFGPEWVFNPASTVVVRLSATTLDSSHVVIAYWDVGNVKTAIVGTVAGNTITFGSEYVFQGAAGATGGIAAAALDGTHVAIVYQDTLNANFGTAIVGTISGGDVITFGATYVFRAGITNFPSAAALDSTHFVAAYRAGGAGTPGTALVGTVSSGDVIAYGPAAVFNPADTGAITPARLDDTHVLIAYGDIGNSGFGTAIVGTVSGGNNLSFGSEVVYNPSASNGYNVATPLDSNHGVIAFTGSTAANDGAAIVGTISGGNNICLSGAAYGPASISQPSVRALDATRFVIAIAMTARPSNDDCWRDLTASEAHRVRDPERQRGDDQPVAGFGLRVGRGQTGLRELLPRASRGSQHPRAGTEHVRGEDRRALLLPKARQPSRRPGAPAVHRRRRDQPLVAPAEDGRSPPGPTGSGPGTHDHRRRDCPRRQRLVHRAVGLRPRGRWGAEGLAQPAPRNRRHPHSGGNDRGWDPGVGAGLPQRVPLRRLRHR